MLEHSSHLAFIVADDDINDKEDIIEGILYYNCFFIIYVIVSDDDSTMQAELKHPYKGARGQVLKSSKGKLHTYIPDPSFLADTSHRVKIVAKHIFSIVKKSRDLRCGCTKADALVSKKIGGT